MTLVLPIVFFAVCLGLFSKRLTGVHWASLVVFISLIIAVHFLKH